MIPPRPMILCVLDNADVLPGGLVVEPVRQALPDDDDDGGGDGVDQAASITLRHVISSFQHVAAEAAAAAAGSDSVIGRGRGRTEADAAETMVQLCGLICCLLQVWSETPIRDTSCCYHPLTGVPFLLPEPHTGLHNRPGSPPIVLGTAALRRRHRQSAETLSAHARLRTQVEATTWAEKPSQPKSTWAHLVVQQTDYVATGQALLGTEAGLLSLVTNALRSLRPLLSPKPAAPPPAAAEGGEETPAGADWERLEEGQRRERQQQQRLKLSLLASIRTVEGAQRKQLVVLFAEAILAKARPES